MNVNYITTGYEFGGRTWISELWNEGELTQDAIRESMAEYDPANHPTDEEHMAELRESEAEIVSEQFEEEDNTTPYEELMADWIESRMERIHDRQAAECEVFRALADLDENWEDDTEDDEHFERVCRAHGALDTYIRRLEHMEFGP